MFLLAKCPHCQRLKITINHPDKLQRRIRSHRLRDDRPLTQLALMARCPGSLTPVTTAQTQPL